MTPDYGQAARNVAWIAHVIGAAGLKRSAIKRLAFYVIATAGQVKAGVFGAFMAKASIESKVRARVQLRIEPRMPSLAGTGLSRAKFPC
ncbi:MAG TPA: hypothetical protein VM406_09935 [Noviherbaspirillum sp.]|nr:hypothetical protein [Noviherbaspirillum sp.]